MFTLQHTLTGEEIQLRERKEYIVGRKNCDIGIEGDPSISRKHAILRIRDDKVFIEDCGSKYKTTHNGVELQPNKEVQLLNNDVIQFGVMQSKYSFLNYKFVTTTTGINSKTNETLKQNLIKCGVKLVDKWLKVCTHLTAENIVLTLKFLQALIDEKPIVTPKYWEEYANCIMNNHEPPNINEFNKPNIGEELLSKDYDFSPNPARKTLFSNKLFIFPMEKNKLQMQEVIECCGECVSWEESPLIMSEMKKSTKDYILIKSEDQLGTAFKKVVQAFLKEHKRTIPVSEIALAIISCSCKTNCNPDFDLANKVFGNRTQHVPAEGTPLAMETQSEPQINENNATKHNVIISSSLDDPLSLCFDNIKHKLNEDSTKISKKRLNEADENEAVKKFKTHAETSNYHDMSIPSTSKGLPQNTNTTKLNLSSKRKADDQEEGKSPKRKNLNPFNFISPCSNKFSSSRDNPFESSKTPRSLGPRKSEAMKENPFAKSTNLSASLHEKSSQVTIKQEHASPDIHDKPKPSRPMILLKNKTEMPNISLKTKKSPLNLSWLSKNSVVKAEIKEEDPELTRIAKAFKDCINVSVLNSEYFQTSRTLSRNTSIDTTYGVKNFKKFKKIEPVHPQTQVIGKNLFTKVLPGSDGIDMNPESLHSDSDEEGSKTVNVKPKAKKICL
ncbi:nibrin isoform X2 [Cylas formicarius]|uniref:nibrin isoform X2 n=1 Tax=Cylas formicarius TaxID=197179 RepID=UPI00295890AD|nr:nibrin isoform X2 [Cylas formicarius]